MRVVIWIFAFVSLGGSLSASFAAAADRSFGFRSFERHVLPILEIQCASCHGRASGSTPFLMDPDQPERTYAWIRRYADDFEDPKRSLLVMKGTQANMAGASLSPDDFAAAVRKWWLGGENVVEKLGKKMSRSVRIPILVENEPSALKLSLTDLGPEFADASLVVDVRDLAEQSYQICRPRLLAPGRSMTTEKIQVLLNGSLVASAVSYAQGPSSSDDQVPFFESCQTLPQELGQGVDQISFAFKSAQIKGEPKHAPIVRTRARAKLEGAFDESRVGLAARFVPYQQKLERDDGTYDLLPIEIQATPMTQLQWYLIMKDAWPDGPSRFPSFFKKRAHCDAGNYPEPDEGLPPMCKHHPVESISWQDLTGEHGLISRLNLIQREFVYRVMPLDVFDMIRRGDLGEGKDPWGDESREAYGWFSSNSGGRTHAVAMRQSISPRGRAKDSMNVLYDVLGNVKMMLQTSSPLLRAAGYVHGYLIEGEGAGVEGGLYDYSSKNPEYSSRFIGVRLIRTRR